MNYKRRKIECRQYRITITAMDTRWLNMFHYSHYMKVRSIKYCVDFRFLASIEEVL